MALPSAPEPHAPAQRARTQAAVFGVLSVAAATITAAVAWWAVSSYEADTSRIAAGSADEVVVVADGAALVEADWWLPDDDTLGLGNGEDAVRLRLLRGTAPVRRIPLALRSDQRLLVQ